MNKHNFEIQEIVSKPPSWLLKWGVTLSLGVIISILVLSHFIKYPDVIHTRFSIFNTNRRSIILSPISGIICEVKVKNGEYTHKGEVLASIVDDNLKIRNIKSTEEGKVSVEELITENAEVSSKQLLFVINSKNPLFAGKIFIPQKETLNIKIGQPIIAKLDLYPSEAFGVLKGKIQNISKFANTKGDKMCIVKFDMVMNKKIELQEGLVGVADIEYRNLSLLTRILSSIESKFKIKDAQ